MVELLDKDSKTAVCKMLKELREIWTKSGKECMNKMEMSVGRKHYKGTKRKFWG